MNKLLYLLLGFIMLISACGCAPIYKYQKDDENYKGYVIKRNEFLIPEYTVGRENKAPESIETAKQRFKRRKNTVEQYYLKMDYIPQRTHITFPKLISNMVFFIFRWPFIIVHEIRYSMSDKYRERIDKMEEENYQKEMLRRPKLREELNQYIQQDLAKEN